MKPSGGGGGESRGKEEGSIGAQKHQAKTSNEKRKASESLNQTLLQSSSYFQLVLLMDCKMQRSSHESITPEPYKR